MFTLRLRCVCAAFAIERLRLHLPFSYDCAMIALRLRHFSPAILRCVALRCVALRCVESTLLCVALSCIRAAIRWCIASVLQLRYVCATIVLRLHSDCAIIELRLHDI